MLDIIKRLLGGSDNAELATAITNNAMLIDVRSAGEFKAGSAPEAINMPLDQLPKLLNKLPSQKTIVVFCRSGNRSGQAKQFLAQKGYNHVINGGTVSQVAAAVAAASKA